ncbi:MAG: Crp/Fnr family transcriptional regulator [Caldilineaceae bacterium]
MVTALAQTPFFQDMDAVLLQRLAAQGRWQTYGAGGVIFLEGETAPGFYVVDHGWIKVVKMSPEGREQILYFWGAGDLFGGMSVFVNQPAPATAIALEATGLWLLPRASVQQLLVDEPTMALRIIEFMAQRLSDMIDLVAELALHPVMARLARRLLEQSVDDVIQRHRWATQAEIAARIGAAPDVINRALRVLVEEGIIELSRQQIRIIDRARLEEKAVPIA